MSADGRDRGLLGREPGGGAGRVRDHVAQSDYEGMQQFVSDSPWDHAAVMRQAAAEAGLTLGGAADTAP